MVAKRAKEKETKPKYTAGQWVPDEILDPERIPKGYKSEAGRTTRQNRKDNGRPEGIWPEIWSITTPKERKAARQSQEGASVCALFNNPNALLWNKDFGMQCVPILHNNRVWPHRSKRMQAMYYELEGLSLVARSVKPKELGANAKAKSAMQLEWQELRSIKTWGESKVREWADVRDEAKRANKRIHVGMVFGICVEKGSELPEGYPGRRYKGRVVLRGNDVRDESHFLATFQDLGSAPASMAAGKFLDFLGLLPGWQVTQADAI